MARKESIQLRRDPRSLALAFLLPLALIIMFGYAITFDVRNIELGILDEDHSSASRQLIQAFEGSGYFRVIDVFERTSQIDASLERGTIRLAITIPPTFQADLSTGRRAQVGVILDGSDANTATIAQTYVDAIIDRFAIARLSGRRVPLVTVTAEARVWYNETLESRNTIVPGLVAVIMSIIAAMLTALTIAREWERGTMEQLAATPVHEAEVIIGKLIPYVVIGMLDVAMAAAAGVLVFGVPLHGSLLLLTVLTLLFLIGSLGLGMFISAALKSQVLATQAAILVTYLPALLLSGFIFSIDSMPIVLRGITYAIPARYYVTVTKGVFLKGVGMEVLWPNALAMLIFATVGLGLAFRAFRKEIA